jgi:hypothetical protein
MAYSLGLGMQSLAYLVGELVLLVLLLRLLLVLQVQLAVAHLRVLQLAQWLMLAWLVLLVVHWQVMLLVPVRLEQALELELQVVLPALVLMLPLLFHLVVASSLVLSAGKTLARNLLPLRCLRWQEPWHLARLV